MFNEGVRPKIFPSESPTSEELGSGQRPAFANGAAHPSEQGDKGRPDGQDIASQTDVLLGLIDELKSITERACNAAVLESECVERIEESKGNEVAELKLRLKEKEQALAARDAALRERDEFFKTKIETLEIQLREGHAELKVREVAEEDLKGKLQDISARLQDGESKAQEASARAQAELSDLKRQLQEAQVQLQAKDEELRQAGGDLKARCQELEVKLQEMESALQSHEAELKDKDNLIQAAANRETEIGKLIQRLSEECGKLSAELQEKSLIVAQLEKKQRHFISDGAVWKKVLGRVKDDTL